MPGFLKPVYVFQNNDGVIHQHADSQGKPSEGHDVQGKASEVDQGECGDDRDGNGRGDNGHAPEVTQENQQHHDSQQSPIKSRPSDILDRALDVLGRVDDGSESDLRNVFLDVLYFFQDGLGDFHRVFAGLFADRKPDPGFAVHPDDPSDFLPGILHAGDLLDLDRNAIPDGHHGVADLIEVGVDARRADEHLVVSPLDGPCRHVHIFRTYFIEDHVQGQTKCLDLVRVQVDVYFPLEAPPDIQGSHSGDALDSVLDLGIDELSHLDGIQVGRCAEDEDRKTGGIEFPQPRPFDFIRKSGDHAVQPVSNIVGSLLQIGPPGKGNTHAASAFRGSGGDLFHTRNGGQGFLDRTGY